MVRTTKRGTALGGLLACVVGAYLCRSHPTTDTRPKTVVLPAPVRSKRNPSRFEQVLWQARQTRTQAIAVANERRSKLLDTIGPDASAETDREEWRRQVMAEDHGGHLHAALTSGQEALAIAHSPAEEYQAHQWLALIACDLGRHSEELRHARRMAALQPHNVVALTVLHRAATCNHLAALARVAEARLRALEPWRRRLATQKPYQTPSGADLPRRPIRD